MRSANFSIDNLYVQNQYLNRNLKDLGMIEAAGTLKDKAHKAIQTMIQSTITDEFNWRIGAKLYERTGLKRQGHRKGAYRRHLTTSFGRSELLIPRLKDAQEHSVTIVAPFV